MPKYKKEILPVGNYLVNSNNGKRKLVEFSSDKLKTVAENSNAMIASGLKIPLPFKHLKRAVPVTEEVESDSYNNGGYWDKFWVDKNDKGVDTLYGTVDAPGEESDMSSPAGKLTNTIKEISACIKESWQDGSGRTWGPCILHGAAVVHPVVSGQKEFELVDDEAIALSVSGMIQPLDDTDIIELSVELLNSSNIYLPPETLLQDLPRVLMIALKQKKLSVDGNDADEEAIVESEPVYMSLENLDMPITKKEALHLLELGALNPKTKEPFKIDDFQIGDDPRDAINLALTTTIKNSAKSNLKARVSRCISEKKVTKEYAEKNLFPKVEEYNLSLTDKGEVKDQEIDGILSFIESSTPSISGKKKDTEELVHDREEDETNLSLSDDESKSLVSEMLEMIND